MKVVNSLIFNSLVERKSINLPQIGSLRVECRAASLKGKKRLELPATRVVYSKNETDGARSVVELIEDESGADRAKAEELYGKWLEETRLERVVTMEGVGRIKNDFFTPTPELLALISPEAKSFVKLERRIRLGVVAAVIMPLVVVLSAGYYFVFIQDVCQNGFGFGSESGAGMPKVEVVVVTEPAVVIIADSDSLARVDSVDVVENAAAQAQNNVVSEVQQVEVASAIRSVDMFHVIAGVYSSVENANKFISKTRINADTLSFKILPVYNGKFLISIFESPIEEQAAKRRSQLKNGDPNLWIFKAPAGTKN